MVLWLYTESSHSKSILILLGMMHPLDIGEDDCYHHSILCGIFHIIDV